MAEDVSVFLFFIPFLPAGKSSVAQLSGFLPSPNKMVLELRKEGRTDEGMDGGGERGREAGRGVQRCEGRGGQSEGRVSAAFTLS